MPRFKPVSQKAHAFALRRERTKQEKSGHSDLVFCRERLSGQLDEKSRQGSQSGPLPGCDIKTELAFTIIKRLAGIHQFLARRKPSYDRSQMFHPCQKAIDVAIKRGGVRHAPEP